jgi:hypothetical protein
MKRRASLAILSVLVILGTCKIALVALPSVEKDKNGQTGGISGGISGRNATSAGGGAVLAVDARSRERQAKNKTEPFYGPGYQLYRDDGMLNAEILSLAGIDPDQRDRLQGIISNLWQELGADFERRATVVTSPADTESGKRSYFIPADKDVSAQYREKLQSELQSQFGKGAAEILMPYLDSAKQFSGLGSFDTTITISQAESRGEPIIVADYLVKDPKTGRVLSNGGTSDPLTYWSRYGGAFLNP